MILAPPRTTVLPLPCTSQAKPTRGAKLFLSAFHIWSVFLPNCRRPRAGSKFANWLWASVIGVVYSIAQSKIQHQPRCDAPVILKEGCHRLSADMPARVANENLSRTGGRPGHEVFQRVECDLAAAAVECASAADGSITDLASHLEGVMAAQIRNVIDELEDVIRAIVLGEAGAATDAAGEVRQCDVRKPADGFRCAVPERDAVVGLAISRALAIRSFEPLIKAVIAKPKCIYDGGIRDVIPLRS